MDNKLKVFIGILSIIIWMSIIFNFSNMNTKKSNGKSIKVIYKIFETGINITNKVHLTNIDANIKAKQLSLSLNKPLRKCAHATVYFILGIVIVIGLRYINIKNVYLISLIVCFIYACTDELHQKFVPGRTCSFKDVLIDTSGCILGLLIFYIIDKFLLKN